MNFANRIEGNWKQAQGRIKEKWDKLTDDDLTKINGQREQLEGIIQQRYGLARDMVRKDIDAWLNSQLHELKEALLDQVSMNWDRSCLAGLDRACVRCEHHNVDVITLLDVHRAELRDFPRTGTGIRTKPRRVAVLYALREHFACRRCYGLAYASQQESLRERGLLKAQKILIRLGAKPDLFELFPEKPPRMHKRTYERLRRVYEIARDRSIQGVLGRVPRVERDLR